MGQHRSLPRVLGSLVLCALAPPLLVHSGIASSGIVERLAPLPKSSTSDPTVLTNNVGGQERRGQERHASEDLSERHLSEHLRTLEERLSE